MAAPDLLLPHHHLTENCREMSSETDCGSFKKEKKRGSGLTFSAPEEEEEEVADINYSLLSNSI